MQKSSEADQHTLSYIEGSEVVLFVGCTYFIFTKLCDFETRGENASTLNFFTTVVQNECISHAHTNTFCGLSTIR